jgi:radical SAM superfamily enzyme YgiQ (UPF0313 family)
MRALVIQPPFVQLNAAYPAIHYLSAWLRSRDIVTTVEDHSIGLYRRIFCRQGLHEVFAEVDQRRAAGELPPGLPDTEIARYLSYRRQYEEWIGPVVDYLSGADPAFAHRLSSAAEFPRGARVEALLESRGRRPGPEDAPLIASLILEDLGDLVTHALDADFGTVRYGERLGRSRDDFGAVLESLDASWIMGKLYRPALAERFAGQEAPELLLISLPFPGTLAGGLACAAVARQSFGPSTTIVMGGGYVSTELRGLRDPRFFDYCDFLSFDAGFGSLASILDGRQGGGGDTSSYYRTMSRREGRILSWGFPDGDLAAQPAGCAGRECSLPLRLSMPCPEAAERLAAENAELGQIHPDYIDFNYHEYLRPIDSANPMHRLWSESPWLKYRLAQGCYWKRCAFCDTELDYVRSFVAAELQSLLDALDAAAASTGLRGLHFVDEAMPMARLLAFAQANRQRAAAGKPAFHFWGNMRFDASWSADRIELLAASGLVAVSGGIEVASEKGLAITDKGFDLAGLVATLVSLRRSGVLVHAYLIYGFPGQDEKDILESADFVRGLFAAGLVDSAFWHRFVLTRHSRMLAEWAEGGRPELLPRDRGGSFAANDLEFEGEEAYERFGETLDAALGAWMEGEELEKPAAAWFPATSVAPTSVAPTSVAPTEDGVARVEALIEAAEAALDSPDHDTRNLPSRGRAFWTAGLPVAAAPAATQGADARTLVWTRRGQSDSERFASPRAAAKAGGALCELAGSAGGMEIGDLVELSGLSLVQLWSLRGRGMALIPSS